MSGIEVDAIESGPKPRMHRGFKVTKNGRIVRTFQTDGEAHGLAAKMQADQIEADRAGNNGPEVEGTETDEIDKEDEVFSPSPMR
ncbi:hypothetical protein ACN9MF_20320 [Methylobacterium fujisawaense]|uniref:hypothetical protein n=1 Tax=Methylobacterium fujisawaense TaxID=107400 RepID=UPI003CF182F7